MSYPYLGTDEDEVVEGELFAAGGFPAVPDSQVEEITAMNKNKMIRIRTIELRRNQEGRSAIAYPPPALSLF